ncbi:MarR family winged helix-turn-helix transcriptional regulator [Arsenicicoccus dermatophilus]|uniref:MarR family winged helix-turn-helix transcriptional regulator n=1 Tax=Arsenicicoccus dermatophilus TaxID=1076331 RepID=UPI001F4C7A6A|nr:MarR family transcriptional regulator [Arsenicicoccus dermatophilus]MCH8612068.1 MarR family transcriptional regulator [Arsenicicoccus dermatophilus]
MTRDLCHLANDLRLACQRISRRVRFEGTEEIAPHQASVLFRLDQPRTPGDLADTERVSAPSMTRTIGGLVDLGLVERTPHPTDGRQVLVSRTAAGEELVIRTRAQRDSWMLARIEALPPEDLATLRRATDILLEVSGR